MSRRVALANDVGQIESVIQIDVLAGSFAGGNRGDEYSGVIREFHEGLDTYNEDKILIEHASVLAEVASTSERQGWSAKSTDQFAGRIVIANAFAAQGVAEADSDKRRTVIDHAVEAAGSLDSHEARAASRFIMGISRVYLASTAYDNDRSVSEFDGPLRPLSLKGRDFYDYSSIRKRSGAEEGRVAGSGGTAGDSHPTNYDVFRLLEPEEELVLGRNVRAGQAAGELIKLLGAEDPRAGWLQEFVSEGQWARQRFVEANLLLGSKFVKKILQSRSEDLRILERDELMNEAEIGTIIAVNQFEPESGFQFSTNATNWIMQKVTRAIRDQDPLVRLPRSPYGNVLDVRAAIARWHEESGSDKLQPGAGDLLELLEGQLDRDEVEEALTYITRSYLSLDASMPGSEETDDYSLSDTMILAEAPEDLSMIDFTLRAREAAEDAGLSVVQTEVLSLLMGLPIADTPDRTFVVRGEVMTYQQALETSALSGLRQEDIASGFDMSQSWVDKVKSKALKLLRTNSDMLDIYAPD